MSDYSNVIMRTCMQRAQHVLPLEKTFYHQSTNTVLQACSMKVWNINFIIRNANKNIKS